MRDADPRDDPRAKSRVFAPRAVLADAHTWLAGAAIVVRGGRIAEIVDASRVGALRRRRARQAFEWIELPESLLTAGLVNAHAHLELSGLRGRVPAGRDFSAWIRAVIAQRSTLSPAEWETSWAAGAARALATGTTAVGDIDSSGAWRASMSRARGSAPRSTPRVRIHRELLDAFDARRTSLALEQLARAWPRARADFAPALSAHAPHTVSDILLDALARRARRSRWPVGVHWSETREELEWLEHARGPFEALLSHSPRQRGLARLDEHGLVGPLTALYHANHARADELELVRARGATLVHCPGTHAFFGREPVDLRGWLARGLRVALGTDSPASNDDVDLRREMQLARRAHPALDPADVWEMATRAGARALGWEGSLGAIQRGARADFVVWEPPTRWTARAALDALTDARLALRGVWIDGRRVLADRELADRASSVW